MRGLPQKQNARRADKIRLCGHLRRYKKIVKKIYIIYRKSLLLIRVYDIMQEINVWRRTMTELKQYLETMLKASLQKIIISNPFSKSEGYKKIIIENKGKSYQVAKYTDKQVFHENITQEKLFERTSDLAKNKYKQILICRSV